MCSEILLHQTTLKPQDKLRYDDDDDDVDDDDETGYCRKKPWVLKLWSRSRRKNWFI